MAPFSDPPDDWEDDPEAPDDVDLEDDDETPTVACPRCSRDVAEVAERCPHCGEWLTPGGAPTRRGPWGIAIVVILLIIVLTWVLR